MTGLFKSSRIRYCRGMLLYRILLVVDALIAAICVLILGLVIYEGEDFVFWLVVVAVIGIILWGGTRLAARGHYLAANILLALIALAAGGVVWFFYALFRAFGGH